MVEPDREPDRFTGAPQSPVELEVKGRGAVAVRWARPEDVPAIASMHSEGIRSAFIPALGERFMRLLYQDFLEDPGSVMVVADHDGRVVGFANGVLSMSAFYRRFLRRRGLRAFWVALPRLVRPRVIRKVMETLRYPSQVEGLPEAEWVALVVDRGYRNRRLPDAMARFILGGLAGLGAREVKATMAGDNRPVHKFVHRLGFHKVMEVTLHDGRVSDVYVISVASSEPGSGS